MKLEISPSDLVLLQKSFFEEEGSVRKHLDSYNAFIDRGLQEVIDETGEIEIGVPGKGIKVLKVA